MERQMSPEERQLLVDLFDRIRQNANNPRDREAEAFIADQVRAQPYAPYLLAQTVIVQDQALRAANERLQQLEQRVHELESEGGRQGSGGAGAGLGGGDTVVNNYYEGGDAPTQAADFGPDQDGPDVLDAGSDDLGSSGDDTYDV